MMRFAPRVTARTSALLSLAAAGLLVVAYLAVAAGAHGASGRRIGAELSTPAAATAHAAPVAPALPPAATVDVDRTDDTAAAFACTVAPNDCSLRGAVINANGNPGTTINVPAGTYQLTTAGAGEQFAATGDLDVRATGTSIVGAGASSTVIQQTVGDRVLDVNPGTLVAGFAFNLSNVTVKCGNLSSGSGGGMLSGGNGASTTVSGCVFDGNRTTGTLAANGGAITDSTALGTTSLTVSNSVFRNNTTATGVGGAIRFSSAGALNVTGSLFVNNRALSNAGGAINATFNSAAGSYNVSRSAFVGNTASGSASRGGAILIGNGTGNVSYSRFSGNTAGAGNGHSVAQSAGALGGVTANNNWWGQNSGPAPTDVFNATVANWLQLRLSASPNPVNSGGTSTLTADIYGSSAGGSVGASNLAGLPAFPDPAATVFANPAPTLGTISGAVAQFVDGQATATYTAGSAGGTDDVTAAVDNQSVSTNITINSPPTINCPGDITVNGDPESCSASVSFSTQATGSPSPTVTCQIVSTSQVITSPHTFSSGTTAVSCTATNGAGTASCTFNVTVLGDESPEVMAPANVSATTGAGANSCGAFVSDAALGSATAADTCSGPVSIVRTGVPAGNIFPVGTTTITYTGTDPGGHTDTATQTVTVTDDTPPTVSAPADASYECASMVPAGGAGQASASDNCGAPSVAFSESSNGGAGSPASPLVITRTFKATDAAGNTATATQTITVVDSTAPTVTAPAPTSASADASCLALIPNVVAGSNASDNCGGSVTLTQSPAAGTPVGLGPHTITVTATDAAGNSSQSSTTFTVNDTTPPTLNSPGNVSAATAPDATTCGAYVSDAALGSASASDNCGGSLPVTRTGVPAGNVFPVGTTTVTYTATDAAGNSTTKTQSVTVADATKPVIALNGANPLTVECHTSFADPGATATDNCAGTVAVSSSGVVNVNVPGVYTVTYTATDAAGNTAVPVTRTVNVVDTTAPTITLNTMTLSLWPPNHQYRTVQVSDLVAGVTDGCDTALGSAGVVVEKVTSDEVEDNPSGGDGKTLNDIVIAADCKSVQLRAERDGGGNGRVYTITLRVRDASGNTGRVTVTVSVPVSQNGAAAVNDGPQYTVTSSCQ